jgi:putative peptidoglycan lipid II flippase
MNRLLTRANKRISLGSAATLLIVVAMFGQALGFLRNRLISANFTVHDPGSSDAFFVAFQIPDFFYYTIAAGALGVAVMPVLADKLAQGNRKSLGEIVNSLITLLSIVMFIVSLGVFIFAKPLAHALAPNLPPDHLHEAVNIMRLVAFNPMLFTISGIITSVQQTYGRFFFFAVAPLFYNLSIIASIYLFRDSYGIVGLGIGALVGSVLQLVVACFGLFGLQYRFRPQIKWVNTGFRQVMRQLPARSIDQGIDQVNSIVEVNRAQSLGTGPVSYYNYATTLHNVPIMLLGTSIATAAFPRLIERLSQGRPDLFRRDFLHILRTIIWLTMPVLVISYFCRAYLARLIFGRAEPQVALIFGFLMAAIFFRIIYSMLSRYFYAQKDTRTPLYVSIFAIALNIYLAFQLVQPDSYGVTGLALAQSIVAMSEVIILGVVMLLRDHKLFNWEFWEGIWRIISVTGFSVVTTYIAVTLLPLEAVDKGFVTLGAKLGTIAVSTMVVYVGVSSLFGLQEANTVLRKVKAIVLKPVRLQ